ncbi:MAG: DUF6261 family protein [Planctomycetaceae bacterium]|jgi:hypothetical protein|nr:DUF6261 family protein [Planctomycetaceae bacterium]
MKKEDCHNLLYLLARGGALSVFVVVSAVADGISVGPSVQNVVSMFYGEFINLLEQEKQIVDIQRSSEFTKQIAEANHLNDRLITGIRETVNAALHYFNPAVVEAAQSVQLLLKTFGEIQSKSYEEEAAAIRILLDDFGKPEFIAKTALLGLDPWLVELSESLNHFNELLKLRNTEQADKPQQRLREIRKQIELVYHNMINHINSAAVLDQSNMYTEFINRLDTQITYFNDHNHHPAPISIRTANVDVIPIQQYTGEAITPIPTVYMGDKRLSFAKDFNLTYKNNIQCGVAEVNITGKGIYGGKKLVTFNIERINEGD